MKDVIHLRLSQDQMRRKTGSNGDFQGPMPLCGNGSAHARVDVRHTSVTCEACKKILASRPGYL
jgi:hypothetical protein